MDELLTVCRFLAGGYFIWSGSSKLGKSTEFWAQIMGYQITGAKASRFLGAVLPPLEFIMGLFFAAGLIPVIAGWVLLGLLAAFSVAIAISLIRKTDNDCGCGSKNTKVRPILLMRNGALAALVVVGLISPAPTYIGGVFVAALGVLIIIVISVKNFRLNRPGVSGGFLRR